MDQSRVQALKSIWQTIAPTGRRSEPFGGQRRQIELVREIAQTYPIQRVIGVGVDNATASLLFSIFGRPVAIIEPNQRRHGRIASQIGRHPKVTTHLGEPRTVIDTLAARDDWSTWPLFAYVANERYGADTLAALTAWDRAVVMAETEGGTGCRVLLSPELAGSTPPDHWTEIRTP